MTPSSSTSNIISQLGLDKQLSNDAPTENDFKREARQIEFVDLMIQAKRRKLIQSLSSRLDRIIEDRIATATYINDLRLSSAANDIVAIATRMIERRTNQQPNQVSPSHNKTTSTPGFKPSLTRPFSTFASSKIASSGRPSDGTTSIHARRTLPNEINQGSPRIQPRSMPAARQPTKLRLPSSNQDAATSAGHPPPKRPTEMPYDEVRKLPDFKRLSWSWTGLIVGIPVLITTSWVLWKDYDRRMMERKLGLELSPPSAPSAVSEVSDGRGTR